ncbi:MAG TPA: hypothetical protein ENF73_03475 [Proteobacteria bacterium]|nr:hypothetical protein [Pseudomonadota bacterium]
MPKLEEIKVGDKIELKQFVDKYRPIYYAGASGDFNLIHIDPEFGKSVGLGGNILQGLCTMAYAAHAVTDWAGDPARLKRLKVRFRRPVRPEDDVTIHGEVTSVEGKTVELKLWAENQNGEQVLTNGEATVEFED